MLNLSLNPLKAVLSLKNFFDSKDLFQRVVLGIVTNTSAFLSPEAVSESVVVLADEWLLQLPLEALKTFAVPQITSISRDFSLQFHYHRVHPAERSGKRLRNRYTSIYKSWALFVIKGDVILRNATLQNSSAHLSDNLYLKETTPVFIWCMLFCFALLTSTCFLFVFIWCFALLSTILFRFFTFSFLVLPRFGLFCQTMTRLLCLQW